MPPTRIAPQSGVGFTMKRGEILRITDPLGEQVSDLFAVAEGQHAEVLSSGRTIDYASTIRLTTGHTLYSSRSRPMFTVLADTVGVHDFLLTPCSPQTFEIIYDNHDPHPSCQENLIGALRPLGIDLVELPPTFNVFMNVSVATDGTLSIGPPLSRSGDYIDLVAEMDLIVGLTACSAEMSNNYAFKPIDFEVRVRPR